LRCIVAVTWNYRSGVTAVVAWPSTSEATFGRSPLLNIAVPPGGAHVDSRRQTSARVCEVGVC